MRAITASGIVPSAIAGRIRCESALRNAPLSPDSTESTSMKPVTGGMSYWIAMPPGDRRPAEADREGEDEQEAPPEDRHRIAGERGAHHRVVPNGVPLDGGDDAGRDADRRANSIATIESSTVAGKRAANSENTGSWVMSRDAEVAVQCLPHVLAVLHGERPVEAELVDQAVVALLGHAALARQRLDRIARDQADQREDEQRDAEEGRDDEGEALEDEAEHSPRRSDARSCDAGASIAVEPAGRRSVGRAESTRIPAVMYRRLVWESGSRNRGGCQPLSAGAPRTSCSLTWPAVASGVTREPARRPLDGRPQIYRAGEEVDYDCGGLPSEPLRPRRRLQRGRGP